MRLFSVARGGCAHLLSLSRRLLGQMPQRTLLIGVSSWSAAYRADCVPSMFLSSVCGEAGWRLFVSARPRVGHGGESTERGSGRRIGLGRTSSRIIEHICDASQGSCSEMQGRLSLQKRRFVDSSLVERRLTWSWHITTHPGSLMGMNRW
jgi:hypothetical protein